MHCWLPFSTDAIVDLHEKLNHTVRALNASKEISSDVQALLDRVPANDKTGIPASIVEELLEKREEIISR